MRTAGSADPIGEGDRSESSGRELLIAATIRVVAAKGLRGLTFRAVAEEANVNNSLVAHYFGNRDGLIEAAFTKSIESSIHDSRLIQFAESKALFTETLLQLLATQSEQENEVFQYEMLLESRRNPNLSPRVLELYSRFTRTLSEALNQQLSTGENRARAGYVFAALDGLVLQRLAGVSEDDVRRALHQLWDDVMSQLPTES